VLSAILVSCSGGWKLWSVFAARRKEEKTKESGWCDRWDICYRGGKLIKKNFGFKDSQAVPARPSSKGRLERREVLASEEGKAMGSIEVMERREEVE
jgi:hypothetical protein